VNDAPIDLQQVRREIEAEVRARRADGTYPAGYERELDALFARFAPINAATDLDAALDRVEEAIAIDPIIPTASNKPALAQVKKAEAKLIGWYHAWVAQEVTEMGVAVWQTLRLLRGRLESLERSVGLATRAHEEGSHIPPERDDTVWSGIVTEALRGVTGRIAVGEAGRGDLVAALTDAGIDAYGVEPRVDLADEAIGRGLEIRVDDVFGHLRSVAPGDLEAMVLRACVEQLPTGEVLSLVDLVAKRLPAGGRLVVCTISPAAWGRERTEVEADLAVGRPLHGSTWQSVLERHGFVDVDVRACGGTALQPVPDSNPDAAVINHDLARISSALFGPDAFTVTGTRAPS
jgi:hypothetical protein